MAYMLDENVLKLIVILRRFFQKEGAQSYTANAILDVLNEYFSDHVI
jgi:hypothetical protein